MTGTGDDNGTVDGGGTAQSKIAFNIREERRVLDRRRAALPPPVTLGSLDFPETGGSTLMGDGWEAYYNKPLVRLATTTETSNDDESTVDGGTTQGTVEGPLTLEATVGLTDGHDGAAPLTVPSPPALCRNIDRCHQTARSQTDGFQYCCERCFQTNATEHSEDCRWWHTPRQS